MTRPPRWLCVAVDPVLHDRLGHLRPAGGNLAVHRIHEARGLVVVVEDRVHPSGRRDRQPGHHSIAGSRRQLDLRREGRAVVGRLRQVHLEEPGHVVARELVDGSCRIDADRRLHRRPPPLSRQCHRRRDEIAHLDRAGECAVSWAQPADDHALLVPLLNVLPDACGRVDRPVGCAREGDIEHVRCVRLVVRSDAIGPRPRGACRIGDERE